MTSPLTTIDNKPDPTFDLTVIDVGHGNATLISSASETVLVDAGGGVAIVEYLLQAEITHVDTVVISHADKDHVGGLLALLSTGKVSIGRVILNSDGTKDSILWSDLAYELDHLERAEKVEVLSALKENYIVPTVTPGLEIRALAPRPLLVQLGVGNTDRDGDKILSNSISAVLHVRFEDRGIALLAGDMDRMGWKHLKQTGHDLRADVLVVPHHGGWWGARHRTKEMTSELCLAVAPSHAFVSNGRGSHDNPRADVIAAIRETVPRVRIACTQVSNLCLIKELARPEMQTRNVFSAGARRDACCAGSMHIPVYATTGSQIDLNYHNAFVDRLGSDALCRSELAWSDS